MYSKSKIEECEITDQVNRKYIHLWTQHM